METTKNDDEILTNFWNQRSCLKNKFEYYYVKNERRSTGQRCLEATIAIAGILIPLTRKQGMAIPQREF